MKLLGKITHIQTVRDSSGKLFLTLAIPIYTAGEGRRLSHHFSRRTEASTTVHEITEAGFTFGESKSIKRACVCKPGSPCDYHAVTCTTCFPRCKGHPFTRV